MLFQDESAQIHIFKFHDLVINLFHGDGEISELVASASRVLACFGNIGTNTYSLMSAFGEKIL